MIITICGPPGSGKDTVANLLLARLNSEILEGLHYELLSIGDLRRIAAKQKEMTIEEFNEWSLKNPKEGDAFFDDFQKEHAKKTNDFILVSRLGWHMIPHSYKVYIDVDPFIGAKRIYDQKREDINSRNELVCKTIDEQMTTNKKRIKSDQERYLKLYGVDPYDEDNFDLVVDSTKMTQKEVVSEIIKTIKDKL